MDAISRRTFLVDTMRALLAIGTAGLAQAAPALGSSPGVAADQWLAQVQRLSALLKQGRVSSHLWRRRLQRLTRRLSLADLRRVTDFGAIKLSLSSVEEPEPQRILTLPTPPGLEGFAFAALLTHIREGFAVVPHGHHSMVSMHVILQGAVHLRQYDRLRDEPGALVIRPVADRILRPGDTSAISTDRGNVHWFRGLGDSFALVIAAYDIDPARGAARDYVDPMAGEQQADGSLRAPLITQDEAYRRYLTFRP